MSKRHEMVRIYDIKWENDGGDFDLPNEITAENVFEYRDEDYVYDIIKEWLEKDGDCGVIDFMYEFLEYDENNH